jgi:NADPH-dependent 7-cyano-7-deazaguanine reductase QueF
MIEMLPADARGLTIRAELDGVHQCPILDEIDRGAVAITWRIATHTIELHGLRHWVTSLKDWAVSHEDYTAEVAATIAALPGIEDVTVTSDWVTAGIRVHVTTEGAAP